MINGAQLTELFADQRWFGGDIADLDRARIELSRELPTEPRITQLLVGVGEERYHLLLDEEGADVATNSAAALALCRYVMPDAEVESARPLGAEQTNTSLVYDERLLLKIFRRVGDVPNRDVEVTEALVRVGFEHVPELVGRWHENGRDFATVQPFVTGATDGWSHALVSLRQLFDEGGDPAEAGGDFGPDAERLGEVTAQLHIAMAEAFGTAPADAAKLGRDLADGLRADRLSSLSDAGRELPVHGDYHLGQVLRSDVSWFVVDFEGEPARAETERHQRSSPLKDVAGMLRSFDYAAAVAARDEDGEVDVGKLSRAWEQHNRAAFLDGYWAVATPSGLLPADPSARLELLSAFELDKALYEVRYETAHRPSWVDIPKAAVERLLAA